MDINYIKYLLEEKREFKSFKELCEHLGVEYNGKTNSRTALERKFRQFFEFEKVKGKNAIIVTEVFENIKPNFKSKGSSLPEFLDPAILMTLKEGEYITKKKIANEIKIASYSLINFYGEEKNWMNMVRWINNYDADFCAKEENLWSYRNSKGFKQICFYVHKVQDSYKSSINCAMKRLKKKELIEYDEVTVLTIPKDYSMQIKSIIKESDNGVKALEGKVFPWIYEDFINKSVETDDPYWEIEVELILLDHGMIDGTQRNATKDEENFLDIISKKICEEEECENYSELMAKSEWDMSKRVKYFKKFNEILLGYNLKSFKAYYVSKVNKDADVDTEAISKLNEVFYEKRLQSRKDSLEKEFEKQWSKMHFLKTPGRIKNTYDTYYVGFEEFAKEFIKAS